MIDPDLLNVRTVHWSEIDELVRAVRKVDPLSSVEHLRYSLEQWWCLQYNRPLKDPLLKEYTINELIYEFLFHHYQKPENDPEKSKSSDLDKEDEEWARRQIEEISKKTPAGASTGSTNPATTPTSNTQGGSQVPQTQETSPVLPDHLPPEIKSVLEAGEEFSTRFDG
jgi:hypothetical protein